MYCKNCGKKINDNSRFCEYCGKKTSADKKVYCIHCGKEIEENDIVCPYCNKRITSKEYDIQTILILFIALLSPIFGIVVWIVYKDKDKERAKTFLNFTLAGILIRLIWGLF